MRIVVAGTMYVSLNLRRKEHGYESAKERKARNAHNPGVEGPNPNRERGILSDVMLKFWRRLESYRWSRDDSRRHEPRSAKIDKGTDGTFEQGADCKEP
jgi:hypothetical protein